MLFLFVGCNRQKMTLPAIEEILEMNPALQQVLQRYASDSLKLKAAEFLIEHTSLYYSYKGDDMDHYLKQFELFGSGKYSSMEVVDSVRRKYGFINPYRSEMKPDTEISPDYLISNIEWAFKVWREQPWGKNVSFDDFCEYILPYRIDDEPLKPWREKIYNEFNPMLDSIRNLPEAEDPLFVSRVLLDSVAKRKFHFTGLLEEGPHVGPDVVEWRSGNCRESTDMLIYICRALGIPCGCDYMPLRGDGNVAHFWNFVLDRHGNSYYMYENMKPEPIRNFWGIKSKVYRQTFGSNKQMRKKILGKLEEVYPAFDRLNYIDITKQYSGKYARTLKIPTDRLFVKPVSDELVYLCGASQQDWIPLAWTTMGENGVVFDDVEGGVVFQVAVYKRGILIPIAMPFVFDKTTGGVHYYQPSDTEMEEVKLLNKYHQLLESFPQRMLGGVFEGSNRIDFMHSDTLHIIEELPLRLHNVVMLSNEKEYRYVRYLGAINSHCNVSEVAFYNHTTDTFALQGRVIGTSNGEHGDGKHDIGNVYDGDPYTSFDYHLPDGGWAGLDLRKPQIVKKIVFTPRNRDNYIRKGDVYELFYSSKGRWESVSIQTAASDSLLYTVPKGALLYLRNHTRGNEERIFEYEDGKQRYW